MASPFERTGQSGKRRSDRNKCVFHQTLGSRQVRSAVREARFVEPANSRRSKHRAKVRQADRHSALAVAPQYLWGMRRDRSGNACNFPPGNTRSPPPGRRDHSQRISNSYGQWFEPARSVPRRCCRCTTRHHGCKSGGRPTDSSHQPSPDRPGSWEEIFGSNRPNTRRMCSNAALRLAGRSRDVPRPEDRCTPSWSRGVARSEPGPGEPVTQRCAERRSTCAAHEPSTRRESPSHRRRVDRNWRTHRPGVIARCLRETARGRRHCGAA